MALQLYQVDYKSFLLDFKSLPADAGDETNDVDTYSSIGSNSEFGQVANKNYHIMEFFEMCASLIAHLAK